MPNIGLRTPINTISFQFELKVVSKRSVSDPDLVIALKVDFYISTIALKHGGDMTESRGGGGGGG